MRYFLLFVFSFYALGAYSQDYFKQIAVNRVTVNYPEHTVVAFTVPLDKNVRVRTNRFYSWYAANSIKETQGGYSGKLLNGLYSDYFLTKNLKEQGEFKKGLKVGTWKSWHLNGRLKETSEWRGGIQSGRFVRYTESGDIAMKGNFRNGMLHGRVYSVSAKAADSVEYYKRGAPVPAPKKKKYVPAFITRGINKLKRHSKQESSSTAERSAGALREKARTGKE